MAGLSGTLCYGLLGLVTYCPPEKPPAQPDPQVVVCSSIEATPRLSEQEYDATPEKVKRYINRNDSKRRKNGCKP